MLGIIGMLGAGSEYSRETPGTFPPTHDKDGKFGGPSILDHAATARYLLGRRTPSGGYSFYRTPQWGVEEPNAPDTLAAIAALRLIGLAPPNPEVTVRWLRGLQDATGSWPTLTIGWAALCALDLLGGKPRCDPRTWLQAQRHYYLCVSSQRHEWRGVLLNLMRLTILMKRYNLPLTDKERVAIGHRLEDSHDPAGGWACPGADLETTAIAVQLSGCAAIPLDLGTLARWWRRCEDPSLGMRLAPEAGATSVGALWGGLKLAQLKPRYPRAIAAQLALLQHPEGGLGARHGAIATVKDTYLGLETETLEFKPLRERHSTNAFI